MPLLSRGNSENTNHQAPNTRKGSKPKLQNRDRASLEFGAWCFFGVWSLVFGVLPGRSNRSPELFQLRRRDRYLTRDGHSLVSPLLSPLSCPCPRKSPVSSPPQIRATRARNHRGTRRP